MRTSVPCLAAAIALVPRAPASAEPASTDHCGLEDPAIAEEAPAVPERARELSSVAAEVAPVRRVRPSRLFAGSVESGAAGGALSGKTVYVSAGHGFTFLPDKGWRTQRPNTHDIVEDFVSVEAVSQYLVRHLRNMGAYVVPVRELDMNPNQSIVDDDSPGFTIEGDVIVRMEPDGYALLPAPITGETNPFASGGARTLDASSAATGAVVWTFEVPESGEYSVSVGYVQDPSRAPDAHYVVRHAGGESHFRVDQRRHGGTWVVLGRFYFEAGTSPERGAVALVDDSETAGATLSADVARIGGGMGILDRGGGVSGLPRFEENARYHAQLAGAPTEVYTYAGADRNDDVGTRSRFAAWDHPPGEDAVYIAWHTNAPRPHRGSSSFAYGPSPYGGLGEFSGVPGSLELMDAVHSELVADLRAAWDPEWTDRGQHTAYFGEVNPNHNPEMPAVLSEIAFHDTAEDADQLREPRFRYLAARAMAQGVASYFAERDGAALVLPPEPPLRPVLVQAENRGLELRWSAPAIDAAGGDPATAYRVYLSRDGYAFDDGREVSGTSFRIEDASEPAYARVTALNAGGESFPTDTVGAAVARDGSADVLVVAGFTRLDAELLPKLDYSEFGNGSVDRMLLSRINDGSYVARIGAALSAAGVSFDAAHADSVASGELALDGYRAVIWLLGEEGGASPALTDDELRVLSAHVAAGGSLLLSGAELIRDLDTRGSLETAEFVAEVLHVSFVNDDADAYALSPAPGGLFEGLGDMSFAAAGPGGYDAEHPDVLAALPGASDALLYGGGLGGAAAVWWSDESTGAATLTFGFPLELLGPEDRDGVIARAVAAFGVEPEPEIEETDEPDISDLSGCACRLEQRRDHGGGWLVLGAFLAALVALRRRRLAE